MKEERKFLRQCAVCRKYCKKGELVRITRNYKTKEVMVNEENKIQGRSIYVCKNEECIGKFVKNKKSLHLLKAEMCENIKNILCTVLKS